MGRRITTAQAREQIKSGELDPLYVIEGDDQAEKIGLVKAFVESIEADLQAFNVERAYGGEISASAFLDSVRTLPLMAPRRLIIVMQADRLLQPSRPGAEAEKDAEALEQFVAAPEPHATVVFVVEALDGRRKIAKLLAKSATIIDCGARLADPVAAQQWVKSRVGEGGMTIEPAAARLLVERAGFGVARLRSEVERVCLYAAGRKAITAEDVAEVAGAATSQDTWAMVNAVRSRNTALALRELSLVFHEGGIPLLILGQLRAFAEKVDDQTRQERAFDALLRTDLALKTSAGDPRVLLERLVVELCEGVGRPRRSN